MNNPVLTFVGTENTTSAERIRCSLNDKLDDSFEGYKRGNIGLSGCTPNSEIIGYGNSGIHGIQVHRRECLSEYYRFCSFRCFI